MANDVLGSNRFRELRKSEVAKHFQRPRTLEEYCGAPGGAKGDTRFPMTPRTAKACRMLARLKKDGWPTAGFGDMYFIPSELPEHLKRAAAAYGLDFSHEHDARKGKDGKGGKKAAEEDGESTHDLPTYAGSFEPTKDGTAWVGEPSCTHAQVKV
jgi:hypothetical protein